MAQNQKQSVQPKQLQRNQAHIASTSSRQSASTSQQPLNGDLVTPSELDDLNGELNFDEKALLYSDERLDRTSPELWPEQIPGVTEFLAQNSPPLFENQSPPEWLKDLDQDDINMLHGFGSLTASALLEKVKDLQNLAYQLGLEEAREMTRGKFLNILQRKTRRR